MLGLCAMTPVHLQAASTLAERCRATEAAAAQAGVQEAELKAQVCCSDAGKGRGEEKAGVRAGKRRTELRGEGRQRGGRGGESEGKQLVAHGRMGLRY